MDPGFDELTSLLPRCLLPDWVRIGSRAARLFRDRLHADRHEAILARLLEQARQSVALHEWRRLNSPRATYPAGLPISARKDDIVRAIRENQVVVLAGETGSGKTTQIPKMCLEAGLGIQAKIGCTQPRRVAALSISRRIAEELGVSWGREVGCKIRFDDRSSPETFIKLMTDGILLAETQGDPLLSEYNAIIVDEAHERSLNIDFLLGLLKGILAKRNDLKLIITSATIDTAAFSAAFGNAPVLEISGRTYPVEVIYEPFDAQSEEAGEMTFVDAAIRSTQRVLDESSEGDVLVFLPGERDIREASDALVGSLETGVEVIPMYGRLSSGDQQRVFSSSGRRKVVVATNIAETSLTIPGIRFVVDAGLARMSRYNSRTRTKRLPVEPISQSSANQRKGRAGRVQEGVCIRLYSEEDYAGRPPFTQPEIQRANLAEVILRMKAYRFGDIETFPFLNPPSPAAITGGYELLQELGALDAQRDLTPMGRDLARLPIDPTLGRMLLQSQKEHATRELLIIASGLSVQDPRERPLDQRAAADAMHRRHLHSQSDFLTLLNIWNAVHEQWEQLRTQGERRKFCKQQFLSYTRMREWQDLHAQLYGALEELGTVRLNESTAEYDAVHRSILSGLLGHVATRIERNQYKAAGNRELLIFPGSTLSDRPDRHRDRTESKGRQASDEVAALVPRQPHWIVAGEIVETSQLFARTVAGIDPHWIRLLAPHLCKVTHQNPHWSPESGRVLAEEIVTFYGFEVQRRKVAFGTIDPALATSIFIRSALVEGALLPAPKQFRNHQEENPRGRHGGRGRVVAEPASESESESADVQAEAERRFPFLAHNRQVSERIESWQTRVRHRGFDVDQALFRFYSGRIADVSSIHELNRFCNELSDQALLCASESDLVGQQSTRFDAEAFPDAVVLGGQPVEAVYAYAPGEDHDGVTLRVPAELARSISPAHVQWAIPGFRAEQALELLGSLPKSSRRDLQPFAPKVAEIARDFVPEGNSLRHELSAFIRKRFGVEVAPELWKMESIPAHLKTRVEIVGRQDKILAAGRDLNSLRETLEKQLAKTPLPLRNDEPAWAQAAQKHERFGLTQWSVGDVPERITLLEGPGLPLYAWLGLQVEDGAVNLRLHRTQDVARKLGAVGVRRLAELALQKDLAWLQKDLRALSKWEALYALLGPGAELQETAFENLWAYVCPLSSQPIRTAAEFESYVQRARSLLPGLSQQLVDRVRAILELRQQVQARVGAAPLLRSVTERARTKTLNDFSQLSLATVPAAALAKAPVSSMAAELETLLPSRFLATTPFERLHHVPRYLKALQLRAERASNNPPKDAERARLLAPFVARLKGYQASTQLPVEAVSLVAELRWMLEEYRVSLFAQELGTAHPISPKRLEDHLDRIRQFAGVS